MISWYKNPVYYGLALIFIVNFLQSIVPFASGLGLVILNAFLAGAIALSHQSVVSTEVSRAVAGANPAS